MRRHPLGWPVVETRDIRDLVHFGEDDARRRTLLESMRLWSEVVCLQGNQRLGPMVDPDSDAFVAVLAGEVATQVGKDRRRMKQWESALVPATLELTLANASEEPAVVLIVAAPPPASAEIA
jgi:quercetin dioxygenase-like cupin family protein